MCLIFKSQNYEKSLSKLVLNFLHNRAQMYEYPLFVEVREHDRRSVSDIHCHRVTNYRQQTKEQTEPEKEDYT